MSQIADEENHKRLTDANKAILVSESLKRVSKNFKDIQCQMEKISLFIALITSRYIPTLLLHLFLWTVHEFEFFQLRSLRREIEEDDWKYSYTNNDKKKTFSEYRM